MAGIMQRWDSTKNKAFRYLHAGRVALDMEAGGCMEMFAVAALICGRDRYALDWKPGEVVPHDLAACIKTTELLRRCMQAKPDVFRDHIVAMEEGIKEDDRRRREPHVKWEEDARFRWWTGLRDS